jgi:hypothetical protein
MPLLLVTARGPFLSFMEGAGTLLIRPLEAFLIEAGAFMALSWMADCVPRLQHKRERVNQHCDEL